MKICVAHTGKSLSCTKIVNSALASSKGIYKIRKHFPMGKLGEPKFSYTNMLIS